MTGKKFGRLTVLSRAGSLQNRAAWRCQCECGRVVDIRGDKLRAGFARSCGGRGRCFNSVYDVAKREFGIWKGILARCSDAERYPRYAGRGISVCDRWKESFENFLSDMRPRPSNRHTIDRINNDGNYEPGNCRWATRKEQMRNTCRNVYITRNGRRMSLQDYCDAKGLDYYQVRKALLQAEGKKPYFKGDKYQEFRKWRAEQKEFET